MSGRRKVEGKATIDDLLNIIGEEEAAQADLNQKIENETENSSPTRCFRTQLIQWDKQLKEIMHQNDEDNPKLEQLVLGLREIEELYQKVASLLGEHKRETLESEEDLTEFDRVKKFQNTLIRSANILQQRHTENFSAIADKLIKDKESLIKKLKARNGIEQVVLQLYRETETIKQQLFHETRRRTEMEILLEEEISELNQLLLMESNARSELKSQLDQVLRIKSSVVNDVRLLQGKLKSALANIGMEESSCDTETSNKNTDINGLIESTNEIYFHLASLEELINFSKVEQLTGTNAQQQLVKRLSEQIEREASSRKELQEKNHALEAQVAQLERQLREEITIRGSKTK